MAHGPHLVSPARSRRSQDHAPRLSPRECLASARWQVHVPTHGQEIAGTAVAGADVELLSDALPPSSEAGRRPSGRLLLTFWIDRGTPERPEREVLAVFSDDPTIPFESPGVDVQVAAFEFTTTGDSLSVDIAGDKPLLRITQVSGSAEHQTMAWCQGIVHELLALEGGQYRLDAVHSDRSLISRMTSHVSLAREAG